MNTYDFAQDCGAKLSFDVTVKDSTGAVVNLTGYTAKMQLRKTSDSSLVHESSTTNGEIVLTPLTGVVSVSIPGSITKNLTGSLVYDVKLTHSVNDSFFAVGGTIDFIKTVTQ